jgi:1,4-dihydroxy-2-naphthoate octaprenyltransferase
MKLKIWFLETRPQFLLLSVVLAFLGTCIAWYDGAFHLGYAILAFVGILLAHISVNTLNDYFDYKSGIDLAVIRTPFSGGSGILPPGSLKPRQVLWLGTGSLLLALPIGAFFVIETGWQLIPLLIVAALCIVLYTPFILKTYWPEWAPGLGMGALPVMGAYFVQTGEYTWPLVIASVPSFILVHNLLLINEFPDVAADKKGGRRTTPIAIGMDKASKFYSAMTILVYLWIIGWVLVELTGVVSKGMPVYCLIALLTLPFAIKAIRGSTQYQDMKKLVPALANNVMVVLITQLLLGIGYILSGYF